MTKKHSSDAKKVYYYHVMGYTISYINKNFQIFNFSPILKKWGLPSDQGRNLGSLSEFKDIFSENQCTEYIREWMSQNSNTQNVQNNFESLRIFLQTKSPKDNSKYYITQLTLEKFKAIDNATLSLGRNLTCLIGKNNSGKSSIIQGIQFSIAAAQSISIELTDKKIRNQIDIDGRATATVTPKQILYTPTENVYKLRHKEEMGRETTGKGISLKLFSSISDEAKISMFKGHSKDVRINIDGGKLGKSVSSPSDPFSIYVPGLAGIPSSEEYKSQGILNRLATRGESNSILRNILWQLVGKTTDENSRNPEDKENWDRFTNDLKFIYPSINISPYFDEKMGESIEVDIVRDGKSIPLDTAGTGLLQTIQIFAYIYVYRPKLLLLDEPDSHIDPKKQELLITRLLEVSEQLGFQIILTTHSRKLLESIKLITESSSYETTLYLCSDGNVKKRQNIDFDIFSAIDDLGDISDISRKRIFILTEDSATLSSVTRNTESEIENTPGSKFILPLTRSVEIPDNEIYIYSYGSCNHSNKLEKTIDLIKRENQKSFIIVHRDSDYLSVSELEEFEERMIKNGADAVYLPKNAAESPFCQEKHLKNTIASTKRSLSDSQFDEIYKKCLMQSRDKSVKNYIAAENQKLKGLHQAINTIKKYSEYIDEELCAETTENIKKIASNVEKLNQYSANKGIENNNFISETEFARAKTFYGIIINKFNRFLTESDLLAPRETLEFEEFILAKDHLSKGRED